MIYPLARSILFRCDPEKVHDATLFLGELTGKIPWIPPVYRYHNAMLEQELFGVHFQNPVGLAAGFDKNCQLISLLPKIGFGFEEVGTITAEPYEGNPRPRLQRAIADKGIIVNYGLKNDGARALAPKIHVNTFPLGVSMSLTNKRHENLREQLDD